MRAAEAGRKRWRAARRLGRAALWLPGLAVLGGLIWLVVTHAEEERQIADLLQRSRPAWLLLAAALQVCTYFSAALAWRVALVHVEEPMGIARLARLMIVKLTMDQAVPTGGISGTILTLHSLRASGISAAAVAAVFVIDAVGHYVAYAVALALALLALWLHHGLSPVVAGVASGFAVVVTALPLTLLWWVRHRGLKLPKWLGRVRWARTLVDTMSELSPEHIARSGVFVRSGLANATTIVLDSATLTVTLLAVGAGFHPLAAFTALMMGSMAASIGLVPGGLGTFEAACVGTLVALGVPAASALAATLLLRAATFWLPMIPGLILYRGIARGIAEPSE